VIVRLEAERVGLAVTIEEAHSLGRAARDAKDAVGNVGLAATAHLKAPSFALHGGGASKLHASHPGLRGIDRGIEELHGHAGRLLRDELVEFHRLPHHRIVEEHDVHGPVELLQHGDRRGRQRVEPGLGQVEPEREPHGQVSEEEQDPEDAGRVDDDLAPAALEQLCQLAAQAVRAGHRERHPGHREEHGAGGRLQVDPLQRERRPDQGQPDQHHESGTNSRVHLTVAIADSSR
jgi:hypothetical protein